MFTIPICLMSVERNMHNAKSVLSMHALMWMMLNWIVCFRREYVTVAQTNTHMTRAQNVYVCVRAKDKNFFFVIYFMKKGKNLKKIPNSMCYRENENVTYLFIYGLFKTFFLLYMAVGIIQKMNSSSLLLFFLLYFYAYHASVWQWTSFTL